MSGLDKVEIKRQLEDRLFDGSGGFVYAIPVSYTHLTLPTKA